MFGLMLPSGNDAAVALALHCSLFLGDYGVPRFCEEMNYWAAKLGMKNTRYNNPHGLGDSINRSTARDICRLAS
jgi:D-alanyl-D-alanine carboxypeptidase (penicillin-binding protein 5/6)